MATERPQGTPQRGHQGEPGHRPSLRCGLRRRQLAVLDELADPNLVVSYPAMGETIRGREAFKAPVQSGQWRSAFPDADRTNDDVITRGDRVVIAWIGRGTHRGDVWGIRSTGRGWPSPVCHGKIIEERGVSDALGLVRRLGVIPTDQVR